MRSGVARTAKRDQVLLRIVTRTAAKFLVVNLEIRHRAARLTTPAVAMQDLLPQALVRQGIQPQAAEFWAN
jgi:hypothetical protein